jgi:1-acyl-sn-glycerol-3-phosphate acyltransferase
MKSIEQITLDNEYHTPKSKKHCFMRRMHLPVCVSFYSQIFATIIEVWNYARRGRLDRATFCRLMKKIIEAVESNGGVINIKGLDNIRTAEGPIVFISNHMSTMETFVFPCLIHPIKEITFIVKESLLSYPFFGTILHTLNPITVTQKNPREDLVNVLEKGLKILQSGRSVVVFPQGKRADYCDPSQFNTLGIKLAKRAGVLVIPIALKTDFWGQGKFITDFGPVGISSDIYFAFGKPMKIHGKGKDEHKKIITFICSHLAQWHAFNDQIRHHALNYLRN